MTVYVESNFVLQHALEQEDYHSCVQIIELAANHRIKLILPAFSLAEPHHAISGKVKARSRLSEDLRIHLSELGRSRPHRRIPASFDVLAAALIASAQFEREGARSGFGTRLRSFGSGFYRAGLYPRTLGDLHPGGDLLPQPKLERFR